MSFSNHQPSLTNKNELLLKPAPSLSTLKVFFIAFPAEGFPEWLKSNRTASEY